MERTPPPCRSSKTPVTEDLQRTDTGEEARGEELSEFSDTPCRTNSPGRLSAAAPTSAVGVRCWHSKSSLDFFDDFEVVSFAQSPQEAVPFTSAKAVAACATCTG